MSKPQKRPVKTGNAKLPAQRKWISKRKPYILFKKRRGEGTPMIIAVVLALLILFCAIAEYSRIWIIAQGVREATQEAIISTVNDNYDDVYHAVREGYAAGWFPDNRNGWSESIDPGDVYSHLCRTLGLSYEGDCCIKISGDGVEYIISDLDVELLNNALGSGESDGYTAIAEMRLEIPVRFLGKLMPSAEMTLHVEAKYVPLF